MIRVTSLFAATAIAVFGLIGPVHAGLPTVMIVGEDADKDTVPRDSRVFRRVQDALTNAMSDEGYDVIDETYATMDTHEQGRSRRSDSELIDIARSIETPPVDVLVIVQIYASARRTDYTTKIRARVAGRLFDVRSGRRLGNFETQQQRPWNAPPNCNRECMLETVGGKGKILAEEVGYVLKEKLTHISGGEDTTAYTLTFENFSVEDMLDVEEYLVIFSGYDSHRPTTSRVTRHVYWYKSSISSAKLKRNLYRMAQRLDMKITVTQQANDVLVRKITFRQNRRARQSDDW